MNYFLETARLSLVKVGEIHCTETYLSWLHHPRTNRFLESGVFPSTILSLNNYISDKGNSNNCLFLAIHIKETGQHIGNIKIDPINYIHSRGEYGILIGDHNSWGKGYAKEASIAIINHCFKKLNLNKITLGVVADNINAVKLYEKIGFRIEGKYIAHNFHDGEYRDIIRMAIFAKKWLNEA